jgi:hypothetical protein
MYHGWGKNSRYFEGWYYKIVSQSEENAFAIIPGIAMDAKGQKQAFVQVLDGKAKTAEYHKFDVNDFSPSTSNFELDLGGNYFSTSELRLDLPDLKGELNFEGQVSWPSSWNSPGIMGPYAFVPFMECYHGILSMDHTIHGLLEINGKELSFENGRGYMEKDWGRSFPSAYIWLQTNHFATPGISIKASVAKIPWLTGAFVGFIAGLWLNDQLIEFTTYNSSKLLTCSIDEEKVILKLQNKKYYLELLAYRSDATELASPILGFMDGRISESMTSTIEVKLTERRSGKVIFTDIGRNAGLEVAGNVAEIVT